VDANDALTAFAVYDVSQLGLPEPDQEPVGFAVTEVVASVGFILRVLIDFDHQGMGYGRALMTELVRRLRLVPDVELVATSHRADNEPMARLCAELGFEAWDTPFPPPPGEVYLCLRS
jgi:diamine N-acetyltransferase